MWTKGIVVGIIILFLEVSVLPSKTASVEEVSTVVDSKINNSAMNIYNFTYKFIGLIQAMQMNETIVAFDSRIVFYWFYDNEGQLYDHGITGRAVDIHYDKKIGFIGKHVIFATLIVSINK
jgi:hypothetical protein